MRYAKDVDAFMKTLSDFSTNTMRAASLKQKHPILLIQYLEGLKQDDELSEFCKKFRNSVKNYTYYIVYYLEPLFK